MGTISELFRLLDAASIGSGEMDKYFWVHSRNNKFTNRSLYEVLLGQIHHHFPWKCIWGSKMPSKVAFLGWTAFPQEVSDCGQSEKVQACCYGLVLYLLKNVVKLWNIYYFIVRWQGFYGMRFLTRFKLNGRCQGG